MLALLMRTAALPSGAMVLAAAVAAAAAAAPLPPRLTVRPHTVAGGAHVAVGGAAWRPSRGACGAVTLRAYVPGVSPYPVVRIASVAVPGSGRFAVSWQTPRVTDRLDWWVEARQRCGSAKEVISRVATVTIR